MFGYDRFYVRRVRKRRRFQHDLGIGKLLRSFHLGNFRKFRICGKLLF